MIRVGAGDERTSNNCPRHSVTVICVGAVQGFSNWFDPKNINMHLNTAQTAFICCWASRDKYQGDMWLIGNFPRQMLAFRIHFSDHSLKMDSIFLNLCNIFYLVISSVETDQNKQKCIELLLSLTPTRHCCVISALPSGHLAVLMFMG